MGRNDPRPCDSGEKFKKCCVPHSDDGNHPKRKPNSPPSSV
ncbi:SEC-C metal-binding domain-containing protein [Paraburkholderia youngii]|nr:SEC-C metal-binding domain-containing protein [Paraburkholderia youngii]NUX57680.1 hypothetical protein [Paraburkholderia youngii]